MKEKIVSVDEELVKKLKDYQCKGVKFMYDACFESVEKINEDLGGGCILAHCMGLGTKRILIAMYIKFFLNQSYS